MKEKEQGKRGIMEMVRTACGVLLPKNKKGLPILSGTAVQKFRDRNPSTIAHLCEFFGMTPQRYQRLKISNNFSKENGQQATFAAFRLVLTKMPELYEVPPVANPLKVFNRLQKWIEVDGKDFCLMICILTKSEKKLLSEDYLEEEAARVRRGAKSNINPSAQRLLYFLEKILDRCEEENTGKYLDYYLDAIEEEVLCRDEDPEKYWAGKLKKRSRPLPS